jgi:hypothetical protein
MQIASSFLQSCARASSGCLSLILRWAARSDLKMRERPTLQVKADCNSEKLSLCWLALTVFMFAAGIRFADPVSSDRPIIGLLVQSLIGLRILIPM